MSRYAVDGTYKVACAVCGFNFYSDEMLRRWDGVYVDKKCWEPRHPLDFFQAVKENTDLPFSRPEGTHAETSTSTWVGIGSTNPWGETE